MVEKITNHRRFYIFSNLMAALLFKLQRNIDERFQKNLMVFSLKGTNFREFFREMSPKDFADGISNLKAIF